MMTYWRNTVLVMGSDSPFCCHREVLMMPPWSNKNCSVLTKQEFILCKATWGFPRAWLAASSSKIPSAESCPCAPCRPSPHAQDVVSWQTRGSSSFSPVVPALPEETLEDNTGPRVNAACTQLEKCSAK